MDGADPLGERGVGAARAAAGRGGGLPGVERGTRHLDELAQPLHLEGGRSGRRRTGSGSPVRLPGEILGRLAQDLPLGRRAWPSPPAARVLGLQAGQLAARCLRPAGPVAGAWARGACAGLGGGSWCRPGRSLAGAEHGRPSGEACPARSPGRLGDALAPSRPGWTRTARRPADGTRRSSSCGPWSGSSRFPRRCGISVSKNQGQGPRAQPS